MKLLGNKKLVTVLLFRGSQHGWMHKDFHSRCDKKGPTISLFKVKDGDCIGGFTTCQWDSSGGFYADKDSFLFNLSSSRQFPSQQGKGGINGYPNYGPAFGCKTFADLRAEEPFNGDNQCCSGANCSGYLISKEGDKNMLTNKERVRFTISEIEVWQVTFIVINYKI